MRRHLLLFAMLLSLVLAFAARSPAATAQSASPANLEWSPCPDVPNTECAGLQVPVDPAQPDGAQLSLRIARVPATDPAHKKGVLLFIPGGPGAGIRETIGQYRTLQHIDDFAQQFDVVSFDPRGVGESSPVLCDPNAVPVASAPVSTPPSPDDFAAVAAANTPFFESCDAATGELMQHLSAMDTAADIERIRQALTPNDGLVSIAGSYGTVFAQAYLERYPDNVKALVLDGVVDHSVDLSTFMQRNVLSVHDAFDRFTQWCAQDKSCALHGQDVGTVYDSLAASSPTIKTLIPRLLAGGQSPQLGWPALAGVMADASTGGTSALNALIGAATPANPNVDPMVDAGLDGQFSGALCSDFGPQRDYSALSAASAAVAAREPRFAWRFWDANSGPHGTAGVGDCVGWPDEATNPPHRLQVGSHPNVLVANPTHDSQTPLINALSVWLQIPDARLLIADVDGHQALAWSQCAYQAELSFVSDPTSLSTTTLCPN
jgi:pimeloyl-ACP methyl ester carboxylesterase